jgi:outer membrane receptor protein involved in Fe transport
MDFTTGYERSYMGQPVAAPGAKGVSLYHDLQNSYVQEVRLQSDPERRLKWTVGGFFQTSEQRSTQLIEVNTWYLADSFFGIPNLDHGSPFGPGFNNAENIWGAPMLGESGVYLADASTRERQVAGFGQIDFKLTNQITLTGGVRLSRNWLKYSLFSDGPENNLNAPFGAECPTGPVCPFNNGGPFAPDMPIGTVSTAENAVTPKVGINFQMDPDNLFYVSIAKGYRPGGAQIPLPTACDADLIAWGYVDADGSAVTPLTYDSDNVWSYEVGAKNSRLFGGLASFSGSAYMIKWKGIQTELSVPTCGYSFVDNLSSASVKGFDASLDLRPIDGLLLSATVGYNDLEIEESFLSPTGGVIISGGAPIAGAAIPWRVVLSGQYDRQLTADVDGYARADLTYQSKTRRTGTQVPGVINHDPLVTPTGETTLVNARVGVTRGPADVSLFVNNLFDAHPLIGRSHGRRNPIWTASTFRPRTIGVTAAFRY